MDGTPGGCLSSVRTPVRTHRFHNRKPVYFGVAVEGEFIRGRRGEGAVGQLEFRRWIPAATSGEFRRLAEPCPGDLRRAGIGAGIGAGREKWSWGDVIVARRSRGEFGEGARPNCSVFKLLCSVAMASTGKGIPAPLVVVGSANADIYVEIDRVPKEGETIAARNGQTLPGGKGANQAACAARLSYPTYFVGQVGKDAFGTLVRDALQSCSVKLDHLNTVAGPSGHAVVMLQPEGKNSIIIVGGANVSWPRLDGGIGRLTEKAQQLLRRAGAVLLQREIPDTVNVEVAKIARSANVPVILDAGGIDSPIPEELLKYVTIFSPNETELARITGMVTETTDQVAEAASKILNMGVKQVLVKLGENGSILFTKDEPPIVQTCLLAPIVVDTTGAGDTFTAAYAVALIEGQPSIDAMRFAAAAASLCVRTKGAIPSMPGRKEVLQLLQEHPIPEEKKDDLTLLTEEVEFSFPAVKLVDNTHPEEKIAAFKKQVHFPEAEALEGDRPVPDNDAST